jgi:hypothetical protein
MEFGIGRPTKSAFIVITIQDSIAVSIQCIVQYNPKIYMAIRRLIVLEHDLSAPVSQSLSRVSLASVRL